MNVSLTKQLEAMVQEKVRSGMYGSASEVVREALRMFQEREQARRRGLRQLRKEVAAGAAQADRGETAPLDIREIKAKARRRKTAG